MADFKQLLISVPLTLAFLFVLNVNSFPMNTPALHIVSLNQTAVLTKHDECHADAECNGHGYCTNESICACDRGWTTYNNVVTGENLHCTYSQRSKRTAFLISLFTGYTGSDWFYLSRNKLSYIVIGLLKLLVICGCSSSWFLTYFKPEVANGESLKIKFRAVSTFFTLLAFAWWIVDWARILGNRFPDGNQVELTRW